MGIFFFIDLKNYHYKSYRVCTARFGRLQNAPVGCWYLSHAQTGEWGTRPFKVGLGAGHTWHFQKCTSWLQGSKRVFLSFWRQKFNLPLEWNCGIFYFTFALQFIFSFVFYYLFYFSFYSQLF